LADDAQTAFTPDSARVVAPLQERATVLPVGLRAQLLPDGSGPMDGIAPGQLD